MIDPRPTQPARHIIDSLDLRSEAAPSAVAFRYLPNGAGGPADELTFAALRARVEHVAEQLRRATTPGARALLSFGPGLDFIVAFFGCLYSGVVAVPIPPPTSGARAKNLRHLVEDARPSVVLTSAGDASFRQHLPEAARDLAEIELAWGGSLDSYRGDYRPRADSLGFLQYTSGSTSAPKGVMVDHDNISHNQSLLCSAFQLDPQDICVLWLPYYHDMGLMAGVLLPVHAGLTNNVLPPAAFLRNPLVWLDAISTLRATISGAPNFAYDLATQQIEAERLASLDLRSWRVAVNGAEPVRASTITRFVDRFAPCGFRRATFSPSYGMAETTLLVSTTRVADEPYILAPGSAADAASAGRTLVGCGRPAGDTRIVIVEPETRTLVEPGRTGEIWVQSRSVARGYWGKPDQTHSTFHAVVEGRDDLGRWLRTGDLGFQQDDELYITGRSKNLIIVRGRNYQAEEIETAVMQADPVLTGMGAAAYAVEQGDAEALFVLVEVSRSVERDRRLDDLVVSVRDAIGRSLDIQPDVVVIVRRGSLPRTTSGKVQRHLARERLAAGEIVPLCLHRRGGDIRTTTRDLAGAAAPEAPVHAVRAVVAACLGLAAEAIDDATPLTVYGLDSLRAAQLQQQLASVFRADIGLADLFDCNTVSLLAARLSRLGAVAVALPTRSPSVQPAAVTPPERRWDPFPLTDQQQAYVIGREQRLDMGGVALQGYVEIECPELDVARFTDAWNALLERHDMLRAVCVGLDMQRVLAEVPRHEPRVLDLRGSNDAERTLAAQRMRMSHAVAPLDRWPQFEIAVVRHDHGVRLCMRLDGTFIDLQSFGVIADDFARLHEGGAPSPAATLHPALFQDHVHGAARERQGSTHAASLAWWRDRLRTMAPAPELPLRCRPDELEHNRFERLAGRIAADRWRRATEIGAGLGCTRTAVLLAAYAQVLVRWSSSRRFTLNVPIANRRSADFERTVGNFSSFTLVELDLTAPLAFKDRVRAVQRQLAACLDHTHVSGIELIHERLRNGDSVAAATMPVVFTEAPVGHGDAGLGERIASSLGGSIVCEITQTPQVWLDCQVRHEGDALRFNWDYVAGLFPANMIEDMFAAFTALLSRLGEGVETWDDLSFAMLPRRQLAVRNSLVRERTLPATSLFDLVAARAARTPDSPAVIAVDGSWTYQRLLDKARALRQAIVEAGGGGGAAVGIALEKAGAQIAGVLGALASGAPYLPLDPAWPGERIAACLRSSGCRVVLTQARLAGNLPGASIRIVDVDRVEARAEGDPGAAPAGADDLAYVLYTSGSTGEPKGVAIRQAGVLNAIVETNEHFAVTARDRVLGLTELHHDMSVYDIFGVLGAGGTLVLPDPALRRDPGHWLTLIREHQITVWNSVPAMLEMLATHLDGDLAEPPPSSLRVIFTGGDWIPLSLPERTRGWRADLRFVSVGGPTETTLWNIWHEDVGPRPGWPSIPYGRPIANTRYFILNAADEDCPDWVAGEMCCAGLGVTPGYVNAGEREQQKFATHPLTGERIYRTGDRGRFHPDGTLEFLGRTDFQLKIRGMRIEPGEVEAALAQHPDVEAAVLVALGEGADRRLAACLTLRPEARGAIAGHCSARGSQLTAMAAALEVDVTGDVIRDPALRLQHKLDDLGVRHDLKVSTGVDLPGQLGTGPTPRSFIERQSYRRYAAAPVPRIAFSTFFESLRRVTVPTSPFPKLRYPSAGGLYPVQTYVFVKEGRVEGVAGGYYYYDPVAHRLAATAPGADMASDVYVGYLEATFAACAFAVFFIADLRAITPLYGQLSRDMCLIEAGYMGQLLADAGPAVDIGLCPIGALTFDPIRARFGLHEQHQLVHSLVAGRITEAQKSSWGILETPTPAPPVASPAWEASVREFLATKLARHAVPTALKVVDALPLSANGKIDRRAIAARFVEAPGADAHVAPLTSTEHTILECLQQALETTRHLDRATNFFDLGASSIHLVRARALLAAAIGRSISVVDLFEHSSIQRLAAFLDRPGVVQAAEAGLPGDLETRAQKQREALRRRRDHRVR